MTHVAIAVISWVVGFAPVAISTGHYTSAAIGATLGVGMAAVIGWRLGFYE